MLDTDLISYLVAAGTDAGNRFHTGNIPQLSAYPAVALRRTFGTTPRTLGGLPLNSRAQFQVSVVGKDYATVLPVANQVRAKLDGFSGIMGGSKIMSCRCLAEPADFSEIDGDQQFRIVSQDFFFVYAEA